MLSIAQREGTKGLLGKCIREFPQYFRQTYHSNLTKVSKWWNACEAFIYGLQDGGNHSMMIQSSGRLHRRMMCKALLGCGRKQAMYFFWFCDELHGEFSRL